MAKIKVLFFVEAMGGGVFTYITNLANGLSNDFNVYVAYAVRPQTPNDYKKYFDKKVHLIKVKNFSREVSPKDIKAFFEMKKICKSVKPDIIHLHSSKAGFLGRWAFNGKKTPLFYTPHGYSFLMTNISPQKKKIYQLLEKLSANRNCTTISCSYGENKETKKFTQRALYVDNGVNVEKIDKIIGKRKELKKGTPIVFTIGRISTQKGPTLFNRIAKQFPDIKFVWIGDGPLRNELSSSNIEITGWKTEKEALRLAVNYDVFLLTSKWEGLPMSLLEAMYLKKLAIVSNVVGNNNVITNSVNGYLCNSEKDYLKAINKIVKEGVPQEIIEKAHADIINHYNSKTMTKCYSEIYEDALSPQNLISKG